MAKIFLLICLFCASITARSFSLTGYETRYTIKKGDTISQVLNNQGYTHIYETDGPLQETLEINNLTMDSAKKIAIGTEILLPANWEQIAISVSGGARPMTAKPIDYGAIEEIKPVTDAPEQFMDDGLEDSFNKPVVEEPSFVDQIGIDEDEEEGQDKADFEDEFEEENEEEVVSTPYSWEDNRGIASQKEYEPSHNPDTKVTQEVPISWENVAFPSREPSQESQETQGEPESAKLESSKDEFPTDLGSEDFDDDYDEDEDDDIGLDLELEDSSEFP